MISLSSFKEKSEELVFASSRGCLLVVMPSGAPDLSWLLCYQLQPLGGFSLQFQLWQQCVLLGYFLE